jgi:hypothetical protein
MSGRNRVVGHGLDYSGLDKDKWQAVVTTVMNLGDSIK